MSFFDFLTEGEDDSEPEDSRPSSFRKAGSESSATESKTIKVSSAIFLIFL
jgi:hypothetical protein